MKSIRKHKGLSEGAGNMCRILCSLRFSYFQTLNSALWHKHEMAVDGIACLMVYLTSDGIWPEHICFSSIYVAQNFSKALKKH